MLHYITTLRITLFRYVAPLRKYPQGKYLPVELMFLIHRGAINYSARKYHCSLYNELENGMLPML